MKEGPGLKIQPLPPEMTAALPILNRLNAAGYPAYFVGGSVRDTLLKDPIHDVDIASGAYPQEVKDLFDRTVDTGIEHGTVMVLDHGSGYEITTFRTESTYTDFRRPDQVTFVRSLAEDLKRRDFTINALALQADGEVVDHFSGLADLKAGLIRAVGDAHQRFTEDALRMMRALRFSAQLDFEIEPQTKQALVDLAPNLEKIAVERIRVELEKLLLGPAAASALQDLLASGVVKHLPGDMAAWPASVWQQIIGDYSRGPITSPAAAWALLLAPTALNNGELDAFLRAFKLSRELMRSVLALVPALRDPDHLDTWHLYRLYAYRQPLLEALTAKGLAPDQFAAINQGLVQLPMTDRHQLAVSGRDLMQAELVSPGPQMGRVLDSVERAVVNGQVANQKEAIQQFIQEQVT